MKFAFTKYLIASSSCQLLVFRFRGPRQSPHRARLASPYHRPHRGSSCRSEHLLLLRRCCASGTTRYTLEGRYPPTPPIVLQALVHKHVLTWDRYMQSKPPVADHTAAAFAELRRQLQRAGRDPTQSHSPPLILDSGCGTGRSSLWLGQQHYASLNATVIGVDRSWARLSRQAVIRHQQLPGGVPPQGEERSTTNHEERFSFAEQQDDDFDEYSDTSRNLPGVSSTPSTDERLLDPRETTSPLVQQVADNVWLVRAELVDFWICLWQVQWSLHGHYLLYPNPYPKRSGLIQRWYGHPCFPLFWLLRPNYMVVRSNWKQYLTEFSQAMEMASVCYRRQHESVALENAAQPLMVDELNPVAPYEKSCRLPPVERNPYHQNNVPWTNFEKKYWDAGEATFEIVIRREFT